MNEIYHNLMTPDAWEFIRALTGTLIGYTCLGLAILVSFGIIAIAVIGQTIIDETCDKIRRKP